MGIGRVIKINELKRDLNTIKNLSPTGREALYGAFQKTMVKLWCDYHIPVSEILSAESFHVVEDAHWAQAAVTISGKYRCSLVDRSVAGDDTAKDMLLAAGVILHSIRAILDFELRNRKELMLYCQTMWYELANGDFDEIPPRFRGTSRKDQALSSTAWSRERSVQDSGRVSREQEIQDIIAHQEHSCPQCAEPYSPDILNDIDGYCSACGYKLTK